MYVSAVQLIKCSAMWHVKLQCSAFKFSAVQFSTVKYRSVYSSAVLYIAVRIAVWVIAEQCSAVLCS